MPRIDSYLVEHDYFSSRTSAQAAIMAGLVFVDDRKVEKPSFKVSEDANIRVKEKSRFVSRGAHKLEKALDEFSVVVEGKTALDAGTSTGGFAQVLLERGVIKLIAVDVGYGQFSYQLRKDKRVSLFERTNIRYFSSEDIEPLDLAVVDLSFISVIKAIDNIVNFLKEDGELILLIKPQFETKRENLKKGVVKDIAVHKETLINILKELIKRELSIRGLTFSPIKGPKGNIEFLVYLKRKEDGAKINKLVKLVNSTVDRAYSVLK